ncbi:SGNH/GDSL hydrolase family protein [Sphingobacterium corticibacterium]|uniref:Hydrolase n=1 Tax=Sphingobacterium corticibacterium TaxID=2484746 RepID=A0A4Q6XRY3_9SPHI|nr:SGNH/GDSL hydrolase family protein [Sphingobacterium corticibacterium]RZF59489.1 hydrolase [Sphingobacterium corticibacterium]
MRMKYLLMIIVLLSSLAEVQAQQIIPSSKLTIQGRAFPESPAFHRIDTAKYANLPITVKQLYTHAAGLFITFRTNSTKLSIDWETADAALGNNSTPIMSRGFDAYVKEPDGWRFAGVARPNLKKAESSYTIVENMEKTEKEFLLYFPLYKELRSFQLRIDEEANFSPTVQQFHKKIIVYGSSIVHGASASRPGLAYPAKISRNMHADVINMGVSGNARMEIAVAQMINDIQNVDLIVMDCVPNCSPEQVTERTFAFVQELRKTHPQTPILMMESIIRQIGNYNLEWKKKRHEQNVNFRTEYDRLLAAGYKNLFYLPADHLLGDDYEGTIDGTHPTDVGFERMVKIIQPEIEKILNFRSKIGEK